MCVCVCVHTRAAAHSRLTERSWLLLLAHALARPHRRRPLSRTQHPGSNRALDLSARALGVAEAVAVARHLTLRCDGLRTVDVSGNALTSESAVVSQLTRAADACLSWCESMAVGVLECWLSARRAESARCHHQQKRTHQ
jgi:hypothetical protein